jgi:hypothetical protein
MPGLFKDASMETGDKTLSFVEHHVSCDCGQVNVIYGDQDFIVHWCIGCNRPRVFKRQVRQADVPAQSDAEEASSEEGYKGYRATIEELRKVE